MCLPPLGPCQDQQSILTDVQFDLKLVEEFLLVDQI